ncbi:hypothetical protein D0522_23745 [Salmonella enterica]|nr:hypothetical protein [Salmonella enterica subsp. enterica serovar Montevideo]EBH8461253.1 hypothetical protein [Salmonella enterica subsp. enterica serovar Ohio]EBY1954554.1 hypothetical protein [Salmonella enterica subsp. enterica serovar Sandiego]RXO13918.1 hypothetical protein D0522_23745 [Salmonella enterica]
MFTHMLKISIPDPFIGIHMNFSIELLIQIVCSHLFFLMLAAALQPLEKMYQTR